jgi:hypothetical protein
MIGIRNSEDGIQEIIVGRQISLLLLFSCLVNSDSSIPV